MADVMSSEKRSRLMSRIKGKDTEPEIKVRRWLFSHGIRYRKNWNELPGSPDIAITKSQVAIFINGCFWHGHENCVDYVIPKTRTEWWTNKINATRRRDVIKTQALTNMGWDVVVIWECQLKDNFGKCMEGLLNTIVRRH